MRGFARNQRPALLLLALSFALTGVIGWRTTPFDADASCCDNLFYRSMAYNLVTVTRPDLNASPAAFDFTPVYRNPFHGRYLKIENRFNRQPPYVYRVVTPLAARAVALPLGDDIDRGFYVVTFVSLALACFFTALAVLELSGDLLAAGAAALAFSAIYHTTRYHLWFYELVDPLAFAFLALGVWLMLRRDDRWFFLVAAVAVFNKETHFFLLASYALMQLWERRLTRASLAAYAGIAGGYLAFRLAVPVPNNTYDPRTLFIGLQRPRFIVETSLDVFGLLALCSLSRVWRVRVALYLLPLAALALVSSFFVTTIERNYIYAFPLVLLSVFGVRARGMLARWLVAAPGVAIALIEFARPRLPAVTTRDWRLLDLALWLLLEGALLLVASGVPGRWRRAGRYNAGQAAIEQ